MTENFILHIETSSKSCSVAVSLNGLLRCVKESHDESFKHSENLVAFVNECLTKAEISFNDLSAVSVTSGPGSYTGLRIGVSYAKGLVYGLSIPLISVDSLSSIHLQARQKYPNETIVAMMDARRMEVYSSVYNSKNEIIKPIEADILDADSYQEYEPFVSIGDSNEKLKEIWANRNILFDSSIHFSAIGQIQLAYEKFLKQDFEDSAYFEPFYLKPFYTPSKK